MSLSTMPVVVKGASSLYYYFESIKEFEDPLYDKKEMTNKQNVLSFNRQVMHYLTVGGEIERSPMNITSSSSVILRYPL